MNRQIARRMQYIRMVTIGVGCTLMLATKIYALTLNAEGEVPVTEDPIVDGETVPIDNGEIVNPDSGEPIAPEPHNAGGHGGHGETMGEGNFYVNLSVVLFCTATAGLMSGLTIGLAAIDRLALEVKAVGNAQVKKMTERIFPVIDQHHWMLVTLLLCNAGAMETLPIFLDRMVPATAAIIISVTLILIFGEVIPQAICTGSQQLTIAYWMCPVVLLLMWLTAPVSWTIAKILDIWLGEHTFQRYDNDQLKKLVHLHQKKALGQIHANHLPDGVQGLTLEQAKMIEGAINFHQEPCEEVMTKLNKVKFTLDLDTMLDVDCLKRIKQDGHSRIPLIAHGCESYIIAYLLTKSLIGLDTSEPKTIRQLFIEREIQIKVPLYLHQDTNLGRIVKSFQNGQSHMAVVCKTQEGAAELREDAEQLINKMQNNYSRSSESSLHSSRCDESHLNLVNEVIGIVTLENVIERILLSDIHDEGDRDKAMNMLQRKQTIMPKVDDMNDASPALSNIFKHKAQVMQYYDNLIKDVQMTIDACNLVHNEQKIGNNTPVEFKDKMRARSDSVNIDVELPFLGRKNSK